MERLAVLGRERVSMLVASLRPSACLVMMSLCHYRVRAHFGTTIVAGELRALRRKCWRDDCHSLRTPSESPAR